MPRASRMQCDFHRIILPAKILGNSVHQQRHQQQRTGRRELVKLPPARQGKNMAADRGRKPMKAEIRARSGSLALTHGLGSYYMHVRNLLNGNRPLSDLVYPEVLFSSPQKNSMVSIFIVRQVHMGAW